MLQSAVADRYVVLKDYFAVPWCHALLLQVCVVATRRVCAASAPLHEASRGCPAVRCSLRLHCVQDVDVAVVKATTSQFHVPPKEKHVKSARPLLTSFHSSWTPSTFTDFY